MSRVVWEHICPSMQADHVVCPVYAAAGSRSENVWWAAWLLPCVTCGCVVRLLFAHESLPESHTRHRASQRVLSRRS